MLVPVQDLWPIRLYWNVAVTFFNIRTQKKSVWSEEDMMFERSEIKLKIIHMS